MKNKNNIVEEVAVTTTDNGGAGLISPQLPLKPNTLLKRYKDMIKDKKKTKPSDR
jgi:hypothetical protein